MRTGARLLIDALKAHGVDTIFGVPGIHNGDRVDRLALAGRLDLSGTQQRENEEAHGLEVPRWYRFRLSQEARGPGRI